MSLQPLNIGLTFLDRPVEQALFSNGITQNVIFLYLLLKKMGHKPFFVKGKPEIGQRFHLKNNLFTCYAFQEMVDQRIPMDILLEGAVVCPQKTRYIFRKLLGARIVTVQYGHAMIHDMERLFYPSEVQDSLRQRVPDMVWASPHFESSFNYLEMLYSAPVRSCPFIWEPMFMSKPFIKKDYQKRPNIQVMEPNLSIMKNSLIPIGIAEKICRKNPDLFHQMYLNNSSKLGKNPYFKANILPNFTWLHGHNQKILFGGRRTFDGTFKQRDILLTHQWGCELNYLYLEALYKNIPLVHNSPRLKEIGYYYEGFDVTGGAHACERAIQDEKTTDYHRKAKSFLKRFSIDNPDVQSTYQTMLAEIMSRPANIELKPLV